MGENDYKIFILLEFDFLQFSRRTIEVRISFDVVAAYIYVRNRRQSPPHSCTSPLCWEVQSEIILVRQTQRSEHDITLITL